MNVMRTTESGDMLKLLANRVHQLEGMGAFDEADMKYIRAHAYIAELAGKPRACLTPEHVGNLFGVSPQTVRNWCRDEKIECWRSLEGWWDIPLISVYELKVTNKNFNPYIRLDIEKVDF